MMKNQDFEQEYWSRSAEGVYKNAHDSFRLLKWICYCDKFYYENINFYDLIGSLCNHLNEISKR